MLTASTVEREEMLSVKNNSVSKKKSRLPLALLPTSVGLLFISSQWSNTYVGQRQNGLKCEKDWQKGTKRNTYGLRERLTTSSSSEISVETEGLGNRQVSLEGVHGSTRPLLGGEDVTSSDVKTGLSVDVSINRMRDNRQFQDETYVDTTLGRLGNGNLNQEHGLLESGGGEELGGVADSSGGGDNLTTTSVDGIGVKLENSDQYMLKRQ